MTFYDTIHAVLNKINDKLSHPINVVIQFHNASYIDLELAEMRSIDEILSDKIPYSDYLTIEWIDDQENITVQSLSPNFFTISSKNSLEIKIHFDRYECKGTTKDNQFMIYLANSLDDEIVVEENGFVYKKYLTGNGFKYEVESIKLPDINDYIYKNLYTYKDEDEFRNAILVEFILRHIRYNNLAPNFLPIEVPPKESETEEEFWLRVDIETQNKENEINHKLVQNFGLTYDMIMELTQIRHHLICESFEKNDMSLQVKYPPSPIKKFDLSLSKEKLIEEVINSKKKYDYDKKYSINFKEKLSEEYLNKANGVLGKFPIKFTKKQEQLIQSLFIFDYIQARKLNIDQLNKNKEESESNKIEYPKMDPKCENNFFYEITQKINITAGQAKKIHNHIHKFLESQIP